MRRIVFFLMMFVGVTPAVCSTFYDARTLAMASAGVALGDGVGNGNPAALSLQPSAQGAFEVGFGVSTYDIDDVAGKLDSYRDDHAEQLLSDVANYNGGGTTMLPELVDDLNGMSSTLANIDGKSFVEGLFGGIRLRLPAKDIGVGISITGTASGVISVRNGDAARLADASTVLGAAETCRTSTTSTTAYETCLKAIPNINNWMELVYTTITTPVVVSTHYWDWDCGCNIYTDYSGYETTSIFSDTKILIHENSFNESRLDVKGAYRTMFSVPVSWAFGHRWGRYSIGVTPKVSSLRLHSRSEPLMTASTTSILAMARQAGEVTYQDINADLGLAATAFNGAISVGIVMQDVFSRSYEYRILDDNGVLLDTGEDYLIKPLVSVGLAYQSKRMRLAADYDLQTRTGVVGDDHQYLKIGMEVFPREWLHVRAGYRSDVLEPDHGLMSVGLGLRFRAVSVDLSAAKDKAGERLTAATVGILF